MTNVIICTGGISSSMLLDIVQGKPLSKQVELV